jgi:hypothetical protein
MVLLGLGFAAGAAAADNPLLPPASAVLNRVTYDLPDTPADPVFAPNSPTQSNSTLLWGYEAELTGARILAYNTTTGLSGSSCVPSPSEDGRGLAFDPVDGNLWYTFVFFPGFLGDGLIHKTTPPPNCQPLPPIPFGDGPGGLIQDDIGALDVDPGSKHIWAAGYSPITLDGGLTLRNYFYLVNRNNGKIIQSCYIPANVLNGGGFNDSLSYAKLKGLPGSGQYLLTDGGEFFPGIPTDPNLRVIDTASCHDAKQATVVATFNTAHGVTGIDFEWPGLLSADVFTNSLYNDGNQPFASSTLIGGTGAVFGLEDISLCGFRAKFGGDGNDMCPY